MERKDEDKETEHFCEMVLERRIPGLPARPVINLRIVEVGVIAGAHFTGLFSEYRHHILPGIGAEEEGIGPEDGPGHDQDEKQGFASRLPEIDQLPEQAVEQIDPDREEEEKPEQEQYAEPVEDEGLPF